MTHMSNKNASNGTNKIASNKGRKGPKPIVTVAQLREQLMREMMLKEVKKIEKKLARAATKRNRALMVADRASDEIQKLNGILGEYEKEMGIA